MSTKVSVIMPVYNAALHLAETLDSFCYQTLTDIELIAVNDGSTDNSEALLIQYSESHPNIFYYNQSNTGPSAARNLAIEKSSGEFLFFLDADDILEPDALESLYNTVCSKNADIAIARYDTFNQYRSFPVHNLDEITNLDSIDPFDTRILWTFTLWNKIFRRSVIDKYQIRFCPISYSEDGVFVMQYIYHADLIVGLPKTVIHYRRMLNEANASITANISHDKVHDFISAHHTIIDLALQSLSEKFSSCMDMKTLIQNEPFVKNYYNEILKKEASVLMNHFYSKFWRTDEDAITLIVTELNDLFSKMHLLHYNHFLSMHPELNLENLPVSYPQMADSVLISACVYGDYVRKDNICPTIQSLKTQDFVPLEILVPSSYKDYLEQENLSLPNLRFINAVSKSDFYNACVKESKGQYFLFTNHHVSYVNTFILHMYRELRKADYDFVITPLYYMLGNKMKPLRLNNLAIAELQTLRTRKSYGIYDSFLANKLVNRHFINTYHLRFNDWWRSFIDKIYRRGHFSILNEELALFHGSNASFLSALFNDYDSSVIQEQVQDNIVPLSDASLALSPKEVKSKLLPFPASENREEEHFLQLLHYIQKLPVRNRIFIFNTRTDAAFDSNITALAHHLNKYKVVFSEDLTKHKFYELAIYYYLLTSKVIIADDYNSFLSHLRLKENQRFIQLWHDAGAFKKFGHAASLFTHEEEAAYHAQYHIACTSSNNIRSIYADAFDLSMNRVKALGFPRTDMFFQEDAKAAIRKKIYNAYPLLTDKEVILFVPDSTNFKFSFTELSETLKPDQIFLICTQRIAEKPILTESYKNILEILDFSINEIMQVADLYVTDYSSTMFEFSLLKKPMAFFCPDFNNVQKELYPEFPEYLPGTLFTDSQSFFYYLTASELHVLAPNHQEFIDYYMGACDGHSSSRIASLIIQYLKEKH